MQTILALVVKATKTQISMKCIIIRFHFQREISRKDTTLCMHATILFASPWFVI